MAIVRIDASRITQVEQFWQRSRYLYQNIGHEDLPAMLNQQIALMGEEGGRIWGFLCVQSEKRPSTLPVSAPNRAYIRAVALAQGYAPPVAVSQLIAAAAAILPDYAASHQLTIYGDQQWLNQALLGAGFTVAEEIQFLELPRLHQWRVTAHLQTRLHAAKAAQPTLDLRPAHPDDLITLAHLDAHTFTPLWHFGVDGLRELLFVGHFQVATIHGIPVGYSAISYHGRDAHFSRVAVHPQWQGQGVGHLLLSDVLHTAKAAGVHSIMLNTQVDNLRAQRLYQSYGFHPTGQVVPILSKVI